MKSLSRVRLFATPWTAAYQAPPSMAFSRQEYWSGVPLPSPTGPRQMLLISEQAQQKGTLGVTRPLANWGVYTPSKEGSSFPSPCNRLFWGCDPCSQIFCFIKEARNPDLHMSSLKLSKFVTQLKYSWKYCACQHQISLIKWVYGQNPSYRLPISDLYYTDCWSVIYDLEEF